MQSVGLVQELSLINIMDKLYNYHSGECSDDEEDSNVYSDNENEAE